MVQFFRFSSVTVPVRYPASIPERDAAGTVLSTLNSAVPAIPSTPSVLTPLTSTVWIPSADGTVTFAVPLTVLLVTETVVHVLLLSNLYLIQWNTVLLK